MKTTGVTQTQSGGDAGRPRGQAVTHLGTRYIRHSQSLFPEDAQWLDDRKVIEEIISQFHSQSFKTVLRIQVCSEMLNSDGIRGVKSVRLTENEKEEVLLKLC